MPNRRLSAMFSALSLLCVLALIWIELEQDKLSPGPIAKVHDQVSVLRGSDSCELCHGTRAQSLAEACAGCHAAIVEQIDERSGFHGTLNSEPGDCGRCHEDHNGADFALAGELAFREAGFADVLEYDHRGLGFRLHGRHDGLDCARCHTNADALVLPVGQVRFLDLDDRCASCHSDPHAGVLGTDCESCHAQTHPFDQPTAFQHPSGFQLTGGHGGLKCAACHEPDGPWAVETLLHATSLAPARGCVDCHASPHDPSFLTRFRTAVGVAAGASCVRCHAAEHGTFAGIARSSGPGVQGHARDKSWHAASGFPLDAAHAAVACAACHAGDSFGQRFTGRSANDCSACHEDPHRGQFSPRGCSDCHTTEHFRQVDFDIERHAETSFPLGGAHVRTQCSGCHIEADPELGCVRFHGLSNACSDCHEDPHAGQFATPNGHTDCRDCHTDQSFRPTTFDVDRHEQTAFPLTGAHGAVGCFQCHLGSGPDLGCVRFHGTPMACAACHVDPHAGIFVGSAARNGGAERCERCHVTTSFSAVEAFDHGETGFPLSGAHEAAACEVCHPRSRLPDAAGRTFGAVEVSPGQTAQSCENCHSDAHVGAFDGRVPATLGGRSGCARCHGTDSFRNLLTAFDHNAWTEFPLGRAHENASCESCHPRTAPRADGRTFGLARAGTCSTCHSDPHVGQFSRAGRTDCARCHADVPTFTELDFDHDRDSRFLLDERHADLACGVCHRPASLSDGRRAVRYKPLGTTCAECHLDQGPDRSPRVPREELEQHGEDQR